MSELNLNYPVMEIAINLVNYASLDSGHERSLMGDIVAVRKPNTGVGRKEVENYLWMRVEGLEEHEFSRLTDAVITSAGERYDKHRYSIPLEKLIEADPEFDIDLAQDDDRIYQPFLLVDYDEDYSIVLEDGHLPFQTSGLIYDKVIQEYI